MQIKHKKVLVIGDSFLDMYFDGEVNRISQEAPVPILASSGDYEGVLGGAANTAANVASLGGDVTLLTSIGPDTYGDQFRVLCRQVGVRLEAHNNGCRTLRKIRFRARGQQLLRVDIEKVPSTYYHLSEWYCSDELKTLVNEADSVIVSDYAKGFFNKNLMSWLGALTVGTGKPIVVDPKPQNAGIYRNVSYITPNTSEMLGMIPGSTDPVVAACEFSKERHCGVLLTKGAEGITLVSGGKVKGSWPTEAREVFDVTGAGDTVVAAFTLALASGGTEEEAVVFANKAAGVVVGKHGTSTVTLKEIK